MNPPSASVLASTHGERCDTTSECKSADASLECRRVNELAALRKCACAEGRTWNGERRECLLKDSDGEEEEERERELITYCTQAKILPT